MVVKKTFILFSHVEAAEQMCKTFCTHFLRFSSSWDRFSPTNADVSCCLLAYLICSISNGFGWWTFGSSVATMSGFFLFFPVSVLQLLKW